MPSGHTIPATAEHDRRPSPLPKNPDELVPGFVVTEFKRPRPPIRRETALDHNPFQKAKR